MTHIVKSLSLFVCLSLSVLLFPGTGACRQPILTIESGGHMAKIQDLMFTRDDRYLVSASNDKTVRVWDVRTGELVRVIRGEIGVAHAGKLYAAALSPDDRWLAVGGWLPGNMADRHSIRLMDFRTGEVVSILKGHDNVIMKLAFSPDGRQLISASADDTARIWDLSTGRVLHVLKGHGKNVHAVAFSPDGERVVTGSDDDTLRLWDSESGRLISILEGHDDGVMAAAFTPDGRYLLSGSDDKTIRMWDGRTGEFLKVLARQNRTVDSLSVTPDGSWVLTGHGYGGGGYNNHIYAVPSGQERISFSRHDNVVLATTVSWGGRLCATGGGDDKEIYIWDAGSGTVRQKLSGKGSSIFGVGFSKDGRSIAWGKTWQRADMFNRCELATAFRLKTGKLFDLGPVTVGQQGGYTRGIKAVGPWKVRTGNGKVHKTLEILKNGGVLHTIKRNSTNGYRHKSLTLSPDGRRVISGGGNGRLNVYDTESGRQVHELVGHTADIWGVACSPDSRLLVSGSSDQTVRLWNLGTGKLLISIFYGADDEWVAWTPEGYYTASFKGDDSIGWHINQGQGRAALYYPCSRFADQFYSPEITAQYVATGGDIERAVRLANTQTPKAKQKKQVDVSQVARMLPPVVFIQSPGERDLTVAGDGIRVKAMAKSVTRDPITDIWVLVNGRRVDTGQGRLRITGQTAELDVRVPLMDRENRISVLAANGNGRSVPEIFNVTRRTSGKAKGGNGDVFKPDLYLLSIGVSQYENSSYNLDHATADARGIAGVLESQEGRLYNRVHTRVLADDQATKNNVLAALEWIFQESTQKDLSMIFIAGHGIKDGRGNYYFLPHDGRPDRLLVSGVKWSDFQDIISSLPSKVILMADTCHSGSITGKRRGMSDITDALKALTAADSGVVVMTASTGREVSLERSDWGHGAFTKALIEGLGGRADYDRDRVIDIKEIDLYITKRVKALTQGSQHPTTEIPKTMPNFPLVVN